MRKIETLLYHLLTLWFSELTIEINTAKIQVLHFFFLTSIYCCLCFYSVTYIEGTATKILEENDSVAGVAYKEKGLQEEKVSVFIINVM